MCESDNRRYIYIRNGKLGPGYLEIWSEDIHGEWSTIGKGGSNPANKLPEETIKKWRGMTRRKEGGQSTGRVYKLDDNREVIEYKDSWNNFRDCVKGWCKVTGTKLQQAGRKGCKLGGGIYVHASQCDGETFEVGQTLHRHKAVA